MTATAATSPSSQVAPTNVKFSHAFSGISVWLEPDEAQTSSLTKEMEYLMHRCGGHDAGVYRFAPHCTLLYNTSFPLKNRQEVEQNDGDAFDSHRKIMQQQEGEEFLSKCLAEYYTRASKGSETPSNIQLTPTSHYYFPYPKTADNGKGFGCVISLLILETTPELQLLHEVMKTMFPPDERHQTTTDERNRRGDASTVQNHDGDGDCDGGSDQTAQHEASFQPHMALIYAPENHVSVTNGWLKHYTTQMESERRYLSWATSSTTTSTTTVLNEHDSIGDGMKADGISGASKPSWDAKYLSIWCTEGTIDEWFPIAKHDLSPNNN
jgi:2'-5' RNA ligase